MSSDHSSRLVYVQYTNKQSLCNCFMSFCRDGGLFVPSGNLPGVAPHLGLHMLILVELPGDTGLYAASGKVAWISLDKRKGIGVRLAADEGGRALRDAIENNLGGMIKSLGSTYTM